jgi:hypothetical protein
LLLKRKVVKSRLSCLPRAEKVGNEILLNDVENWAIVDAPLAREILCYCIRQNCRFEPIESANERLERDRRNAQYAAGIIIGMESQQFASLVNFFRILRNFSKLSHFIKTAIFAEK